MSAALTLDLYLYLYLLAVNFLCTFPFLISLSESQIASSTKEDSGGNQLSRNETSICGPDIVSFLPPAYRHQHGFGSFDAAGGSTCIKFLQDHDNVTTIIVSRDRFSGWMGVGFSKDGGMVGSTAVVGWTGRTKDEDEDEDEVKPGIAKFFLQGKDVENVISFGGDQFMNFTHNPPFVFSSNELFYMGFQAKFNARLGQEYVILATGTDQPYINRNCSKVTLTKHADQAVLRVDFTSGDGSSKIA